MEVSAEVVKQLRDATGVSVMECKKALDEAEGDMDRAVAILKARSATMVAKKSDRDLASGVVSAYVHSTARVGAMIVLACETDFVAKNEEYSAIGRDIAMHVTAMRPETIEALMLQPFIKDSSKTIVELLAGATQKFGERIEVTQMTCFSVN